MASRTTGYWITTALFCLMLGGGGLAYLVRADYMVENMTRLGYPMYFLTILGVAKVLGVLALAAPGWSLLKEWAYAGFAFDLIGATASHALAGDPLSEVVRPLFPLALGAASYLLRPPGRRLGSSPAFGSQGAAQG